MNFLLLSLVFFLLDYSDTEVKLPKLTRIILTDSNTLEIGINLSFRLSPCYILGIGSSKDLPIYSKFLYPYSKPSLCCPKLLLAPWALQTLHLPGCSSAGLTVFADKSTTRTLHEEIWQHQHPSPPIFSSLATSMSILFHICRQGKWEVSRQAVLRLVIEMKVLHFYDRKS